MKKGKHTNVHETRGIGIRRIVGGAPLQGGKEAMITLGTAAGNELTLFIDLACLGALYDFASLLTDLCRQEQGKASDDPLDIWRVSDLATAIDEDHDVVLSLTFGVGGSQNFKMSCAMVQELIGLLQEAVEQAVPEPPSDAVQ